MEEVGGILMIVRSNRLFIDSDNRYIYSNIRNKYSHLKLYNSDIFSLALTIGYFNGVKKSLKRKHAFIRNETIPEDLFSIMILIAIKEFGEDNHEWINNPLVILDLAEEYANAGIEILNDFLEDYDKDLTMYLSDIIFELYEDSVTHNK